MRNFPDFLTAYAEFARDAFCPPQFHFWTGVSLLAGAMERKVWVSRGKFNLHPNLYILLVSRPGVGKSSAGNIGADLLGKIGTEENRIRFLATQNSQASFIAQFNGYKEFYVKERKHTHSSGYFYASEGSNALMEIKGGGNILTTLTDFYDCPPRWEKVLISGEVKLMNVCCSMLACVTFSFLEQLVPQREAEGGFASRLIFVLQDEVFVRTPKWDEEVPPDIKDRLLADLNQIHSLTGPFKVAPEFKRTYEDWFPINDAHRQGLKSERMQHFLARKHTNLLKLCMICSISESNNMTLEVRHWERAMELLEREEAKLPKVVKNSVTKDTPKGLTYNVMRILKEHGSAGTLPRDRLLQELISFGADTTKVDVTLQALHRSNLVLMESGPGGSQRFRLIGNPEDYL